MNKTSNLTRLTGVFLLGSVSAAVSAQDVSVCQGTLDNNERLACYDRIFGTTATVLAETATSATAAAEADVEVKPQGRQLKLRWWRSLLLWQQ